MVFAGIFKRIKNGLNSLVNTGANVVKTWANVNEKLTNGANTVLNVISPFIPGIPAKLITGAGKLATKMWSGIYDGIGNAADKVIDYTSNQKKISNSSISNLTNNSSTNYQQDQQYNSQRPLKGPGSTNPYSQPNYDYEQIRPRRPPHHRRRPHPRDSRHPYW